MHTQHPPESPVPSVVSVVLPRPLPRWARAGLPALGGLAALSFGSWVFLDHAAARAAMGAGAGVEWLGYGLGGVAWFALGLLGLAWCISRASHPPLGWRAILALELLYLPLALATAFLLDLRLDDVQSGWIVPALAALGVLWLGVMLRRVGAPRVAPAVVVATLYLAAFGWVSGANGVSAELWYVPEPSSADGVEPVLDESGERLLYAQSARLDAALAGLAPRVPGRANLFFVGFAGHGDERVFAEEIRFAARAVAQRYGSGSRSLMLLNDRRAPNAAPLATVVALEQALQGVAQRMDVAQDVLFLVLSSHGSEDPLLSVTLGELPLEQLDGVALRNALDEAGIRWRVIVISACHAGAFIPALEGPGTIVVTAAAADRTSFGCSDQRDLTYFGEALFRDALPRAASLRQAFDAAKAAIRARERKEGVEASEPQAYFGTEMLRRWAPFDAGAPQ